MKRPLVEAATTPVPLVRRAGPFGGLRGPQPGGWAGDRGMAAGITDTVAGTLRLGARDYDPVTGAFTQPDPILDVTDPAQWNPYAYGAGNPVDRPDPSGLAYCTSTACGGGSTGSLGESGIITETPTRTTSSSGGGSRGGGGSRYHGGGYNGGGHRAYRYTTRRAPARTAVSKARYRAPARPATVTPLPPPPNPYLLCGSCVLGGAAAGGALGGTAVAAAAAAGGVTTGIIVVVGIIEYIRRQHGITTANQAADDPTPTSQPGPQAKPETGPDSLTDKQRITYDDATTKNNRHHIFAKKHNLDPLVEKYGSEEAVAEQLVKSLDDADDIPESGRYEVSRNIGGQRVTIRGNVVNGVP